jgi:hypothetical protein
MNMGYRMPVPLEAYLPRRPGSHALVPAHFPSSPRTHVPRYALDPASLTRVPPRPLKPLLGQRGRPHVALESYRDAHGEATLIGMVEGDVVDFMNSFGEMWNGDGSLAE